MNRDELLKTLETLHATLDDTTEVDDKTREMLRKVTDDIQQVLREDSEAKEPDASDTNSLSEQLRETLIEFEARHPQVAGILERLTSGLANLGI